MDGHGYQNIEQLRSALKNVDQRKLYYFREGVQLYPHIIDSACTYCDLCVKS